MNNSENYTENPIHTKVENRSTVLIDNMENGFFNHYEYSTYIYPETISEKFWKTFGKLFGFYRYTPEPYQKSHCIGFT